MNIRYVIFMLSVIFLVGCSTKYQSVGYTGGFSETQLSQNAFNVSFRGNGFTSRQQVADFTLLRSAELTLQNGFQYFILTNADKYTDTYTTSERYNTTFNANTYGNQTYGTAYTTKSGGHTYVKPSQNNTILCFKEKPNYNGLIYDANFVVQSIKTKYEIK